MAVRHGTAFINHGNIFSPPLPLLFVVPLGTVALLIALQSMKTTSSPLRARGLLLIVSGGVSNLYDRLLRGGVVDVMHIGRLYFNLADLVLLVGIVIIVQPLFVRRDSYSGSTSPFQGDGTGSTPVSRSLLRLLLSLQATKGKPFFGLRTELIKQNKKKDPPKPARAKDGLII